MILIEDILKAGDYMMHVEEGVAEILAAAFEAYDKKFDANYDVYAVTENFREGDYISVNNAIRFSEWLAEVDYQLPSKLDNLLY